MTTTPKTSSTRGAPLSVREYEPLARELLDPVHHDYFAGGAHDEITLRANEAAFARLALVPRVLRGGVAPT